MPTQIDKLDQQLSRFEVVDQRFGQVIRDEIPSKEMPFRQRGEVLGSQTRDFWKTREERKDNWAGIRQTLRQLSGAELVGAEKKVDEVLNRRSRAARSGR